MIWLIMKIILTKGRIHRMVVTRQGATVSPSSETLVHLVQGGGGIKDQGVPPDSSLLRFLIGSFYWACQEDDFRLSVNTANPINMAYAKEGSMKFLPWRFNFLLYYIFSFVISLCFFSITRFFGLSKCPKIILSDIKNRQQTIAISSNRMALHC